MHILYVLDKMQKFESSLKMSSTHSELTKHCTALKSIWYEVSSLWVQNTVFQTELIKKCYILKQT